MTSLKGSLFPRSPSLLGFMLAVALLAAACGGRAAPSPTPVPPPSGATSSAASTPAPALAPTQQAISSPEPPLATLTPREPVLGQRAREYIRTLAETIGRRDSQSGGEARAAQYLASRFSALGYQVRTQPFTIEMYSSAEPGLTLLGPQEQTFQAEPLRFSTSGRVAGPLVEVGLARAEDIPAEGLQGKVALIQRGTITFTEKVQSAARRGAVAAVIYNNRPGPTLGSLTSRSTIPVVGISQEDGEALKGVLAKGEVQVRVWVKVEEVQSQNVIAELRGSAPDPRVVILGGHYDSVPAGPGANDNASGTAVVLTLAEELAGRSVPFTLRFMGFGSEEIGLVGSQRYVESLSQEERSRILAVLNFDVVGSPIPLATRGHTSLALRLREVANGLGMDLAGAPPDALSDHESFLRANIPAVILTTPDFSRIHTPQDTLEHVDARALDDTIALALAYLEALASEVEGKPSARAMRAVGVR
ncbi:MAG: M20/M25/M40 family metallo-hydrolase [Chloroflexi bacterium]|nr:M20/M25/M40 family metallo-hydrolase [Chloroflexota bacterium]